MSNHDQCKDGKCSNCDCDIQPEDLVFGTTEKARENGQRAMQRSTGLKIITQIVEYYNGTIDIDLNTDTLNINVPKEHEAECARKIEEASASYARSFGESIF